MQKASICLVPSLMRDPFPTTVLEAMSAGKPVIATNHGGAAEVIVDGENGYLIPPNEPDQLAQVLMRAIENPSLIRQMGCAAKSTFDSQFTMEHFAANWMKTHSSLYSQFENQVSKIDTHKNGTPMNKGIQVVERNC
jgi:glycosyltransferase involved in cell wall biosynthesis